VTTPEPGPARAYRRLTLVLAFGALAPAPVAAGPARVVVLNDDGGWCWFQDERALVVGTKLLAGSVAAGRHEAARRGAVEVAFLDLANGDDAGQARLDQEPVPPADGYDDHEAPAFAVRSDGRLLAVYAGHGTENRFRYRVSTRPGDPSEWEAEQAFSPSPSSSITYSNLQRLEGEGGRLYDFFRGLDDLFKPSVAWSDDDGETWTRVGVLVDVPSEVRHRPYVKYASDGRRSIHFAYTEGHPRDFDNGLYHAELRDGRLRRSDGTPVADLDAGLARPQLGTRIFEGHPDAVAWVADLELDADGRPFVGYSVQRDSAGLPRGQGGLDHRYRLARWDGTRWRDEEIAFAGTRLYPGEDDYTGGIALVPGDPDRVFVSTDADPATGQPLASASDGRRHWELFEGRRGTSAAMSGNAAWQWTPITSDSDADNLRPVVPRKPGPPIVLWLRGRYRSYTDYDLELVARLP